jgi:hypothetical protein
MAARIQVLNLKGKTGASSVTAWRSHLIPLVRSWAVRLTTTAGQTRIARTGRSRQAGAGTDQRYKSPNQIRREHYPSFGAGRSGRAAL